MLYFLCRRSVLHGRQATTASQSHTLFHLFPNDPTSFRLSNTLRLMSTTSNQNSFTVSYLINKLGFSPESALAASKYVHLKAPNSPDSVIAFFEKHGFSKSHIKTMVNKVPRLLASDAEKTFLPKLKFLQSKGVSSPDLAKLLSSCPNILLRSLDRQIIPFFNTYSNLIQSDEKTIKAIKWYPFLIGYDVNIIDAHLLPNMNILRDHGVPESNVIKMLHQFPRALLINPGGLKEVVERVEETGLNPQIVKFVYAVSVLAGMSKSIRERKVDVYKKWGWSDKEIWECFRKYPSCFAVSEDRIMAIMDFLVNRMSFASSHVAKQPSVLSRSFEKRIVPRGLFAQRLLSKGLIKDLKLSPLFDTTEERFLKSFVARHLTEAPELLELYNEILKNYNPCHILEYLVTPLFTNASSGYWQTESKVASPH